MKRLAIFPMLAIWLFGCSMGPGPGEVVSKFINVGIDGKDEEAYSLISSEDKEMESFDAFSKLRKKGREMGPPWTEMLKGQISFQVKDVKTEGDKAHVTVDITMPDLMSMMGELIGPAMLAALSGEKNEEAMKKFAETMKGKKIPTRTETKVYDLVKEKDGWKVFLNYKGEAKERELKAKVGELKEKAENLEKKKQYMEAKAVLEEASMLNPQDEKIPDKIKEMDVKAIKYKEKQDYFEKIEVRNVYVGKSNFDEVGAFGEIKNLGDKTLKRVEITIYCLDKAGNVVHEKTYLPVLVTKFSFGDDKPLKPNYTRKFGCRLDDAPSDWAKKVKVAVTDVEFQ